MFRATSNGQHCWSYLFTVFDDGSWPGTLATRCCQSGESFDAHTGEIHVRASAERLQTQTLGVVISGNTRLDFYMQPK